MPFVTAAGVRYPFATAVLRFRASVETYRAITDFLAVAPLPAPPEPRYVNIWAPRRCSALGEDALRLRRIVSAYGVPPPLESADCGGVRAALNVSAVAALPWARCPPVDHPRLAGPSLATNAVWTG